MTALLYIALCFFPPLDRNGSIVWMEPKGGGYTSGVAYCVKEADEKKGILILTCAHGKKDGQKLTVHWPKDSQASSGKVIAIDEDKDLAVVRVEDHWPQLRFYPIIPENTRELQKDDEVRLTGYGRAVYFERHTKVIGPHIITMVEDKKIRRLIRTEAPGRKGDSGSAIICKGWLCGIHIGGIENEPGYRNHDALFVRHQEIWEFLKEVKLTP